MGRKIIDWKKIKKEYVFGNTSLPKLSKKHNVAYSTLSMRASREKWVELKAQKQAEIEQSLIENTTKTEIAKLEKLNEIHLELYDEGIELVKSLLEDYKKHQLRVKKGELNKSLSPFNLEKIFICMEKAQRGQRLALNADKRENEQTENEPEIKYITNLDLDKI